MTQGELFPSPYAPVPRARRKPSPAVKYTRYQPKRRTLCDDCVRDIHERGVAVAPLPQTVRWRRTGPDNAVALLCDRHRRERGEHA